MRPTKTPDQRPTSLDRQRSQIFNPGTNYGDLKIPFLDPTKDLLYRILGRRFSTSDDPTDIKKFVADETIAFMDKVDNDPSPANLKLRMFKLSFQAYSNWNFAVHDVDPIWVRDSLRPAIARYLARWAGLPKAGASFDILFLRHPQRGLGLPDPFIVFQAAKVSYCFTRRMA